MRIEILFQFAFFADTSGREENNLETQGLGVNLPKPYFFSS